MSKLFRWVPTTEQELALKAALLPPEAAFIAWEELAGTYNIRELDPGSNRLLPLIYENLKPFFKRTDPLLPLLRGTQKKCWYKNSMMTAQVMPLFRELRSRGIRITLLKGIHLSNEYYGNPALRPMRDIDFHVSWKDVAETGDVLESMGWRLMAEYRYPVFSENFMSMVKSAGFRNSLGYQCDLHWNILSHRCFPDADKSFLERSNSIRMEGLEFQILSAEELILQLLEHGAYYNPTPSVRWAADVCRVLKKKKMLDWERVVSSTVEMNLEVPVLAMLDYLRRAFSIHEAEYPVQMLKGIPVSPEGVKLYKAMMPAGTVLGNSIRQYLRLYRRYCLYISEEKKMPTPGGIAGFVSFLKFRWNTKSYFIFPVIFIRKLAEKVFRYLKRRLQNRQISMVEPGAGGERLKSVKKIYRQKKGGIES